MGRVFVVLCCLVRWVIRFVCVCLLRLVLISCCCVFLGVVDDILWENVFSVLLSLNGWLMLLLC